MMIRSLLLLRIHKYKRKFIKKLRSNKYTLELTEQYSKPKKISSIVMKYLSSQYSYIFFPIIWCCIFCVIIFIIYAINQFKCTTDAIFHLRVAHFGGVVFYSGIVGISIIIDLILNLKNIFCCNWRVYFFKDDPYHFRLDMLASLTLIPVGSIWFFAPVPQIIGSIFVETGFFMGYWLTGLQALIITIIKFLILSLKNFLVSLSIIKNKGSFRKKMTSQQIIDDPILLDVFMEFSDLEWSSENILFKLDVQEYKKLKEDSRLSLSLLIKNRYLEFQQSTLEINANEADIIEVTKKIDSGLLKDDLFDKLEKTADVNLADTISRFLFSSLYNSHLIELEKEKKTLSLE